MLYWGFMYYTSTDNQQIRSNLITAKIDVAVKQIKDVR